MGKKPPYYEHGPPNAHVIGRTIELADDCYECGGTGTKGFDPMPCDLCGGLGKDPRTIREAIEEHRKEARREAFEEAAEHVEENQEVIQNA